MYWGNKKTHKKRNAGLHDNDYFRFYFGYIKKKKQKEMRSPI